MSPARCSGRSLSEEKKQKEKRLILLIFLLFLANDVFVFHLRFFWQPFSLIERLNAAMDELCLYTVANPVYIHTYVHHFLFADVFQFICQCIIVHQMLNPTRKDFSTIRPLRGIDRAPFTDAKCSVSL